VKTDTLHYSTLHSVRNNIESFHMLYCEIRVFLVLPYVCLCFYVSHHIYLQPHSKILSCTCAICMLWTHHLKDSLQQTNICIKTPKLMWNIIRIRIFSFPNSKQKHFKNQRSAKNVLIFRILLYEMWCDWKIYTLRLLWKYANVKSEL
jgi:hypothetical protein